MLKVLEIGHHAAGYAGRLFVRAGFDVVRVAGQEKPAWGSREAMDLYLHRGKSSADDIEEALVEADIVVCETSTADAMLATGYDVWSCPKVAITPFGLSGPKRNWRATPSTLLAMGGYTHLMGDAGREPLTLPGHYLEFQTGTLAFSAALALLRANRPGGVDLSMFETLMSLSQFTTVRWHCAGEVRARHGSDFWFVAPSDLFRCADGWVYVSIVPTFWDAFTVFLGRPDLVMDERFANNDLRMTHREALYRIIAKALERETRAVLESRAAECRVPVGIVRTLEQVLAEPHLEERGRWETIDAAGGSVRVPLIPYSLTVSS